jgi:hypothetical protein
MSWRRHRVRKPKLSRVIRRLEGDETAVARMVLKAQQRVAEHASLAGLPTPEDSSRTMPPREVARPPLSLPKAANLSLSGRALRY